MKHLIGVSILIFVLICFSGAVSALSFSDTATANTNHPYIGKVALKDTTVEVSNQGQNKLIKTSVGKVVGYSSTFVKFKCTTRYNYISPFYNHSWIGEVFYKTLTRSASYTDSSWANTDNPYIGQRAYGENTIMTQIKGGRTWKTVTTTTGRVSNYYFNSVTFKCTKINKMYVSGKLIKVTSGPGSYVTLPIYI